MKIVFKIRGGSLSIIKDNGEIYTLKATSGRGGCMNNPSERCQKSLYEGPIPKGNYYIDPFELSDPSLLWDCGRRLTGDWGDWRIPIKILGMARYGRTNFFIHGGGIQGSSGCIDIGGGLTGNENTDRLKKDIVSCRHSINLEVR